MFRSKRQTAARIILFLALALAGLGAMAGHADEADERIRNSLEESIQVELGRIFDKKDDRVLRASKILTVQGEPQWLEESRQVIQESGKTPLLRITKVPQYRLVLDKEALY